MEVDVQAVTTAYSYKEEETALSEPTPEEQHPLANGVHDPSTVAVAPEQHEATTAYETGVVPESGGSEKFQKYYAAVQADPNDFTSWTCLLQTAEQEDISDARKVFDEFLRMYPYCYGYWKKYADLEKKNSHLDMAQGVFQRGIAAIPLSIDLWVHFLNFTSQVTKTQAESYAVMRSLFENAIDAAGLEFCSDKLWEAYIEWEKSLSNWKVVLSLYDRLLHIPTQQYKKHFEKFKQFVESRQPSEILPTEEYLKLRSEVAAIPPGVNVSEDADALIPPGAPGTINEASDGTAPPGDSAEEELIIGQPASQAQNSSEMSMMRDKIISMRESVYQLNEEEVVRRVPYEEGIKRPYFHVKPLERSQITNWQDYLEFEIACGDERRIEILFERCLIACALYEEMWQKYATYMAAIDANKARDIYTRACTIHLYRKVNINVNWAAFEESQGNAQGAATILDNVSAACPGLIAVLMRRIGMYVRCGHIEQAYNLYESVIAESSSQEEKTFLSLKYARLLAKAGKNKAKAREILEGLLEQDKANQRVYLQLLDLEINIGDLEQEKVDAVFQRVKSSASLSESFKRGFAQRELSLLEETGRDIATIARAYSEHATQYKVEDGVVQKKRAGDEDVGDESQTKMAKIDATADATQQAYSVAGAADTTNAANTMAYAAGYTDPWAAYAQTAANYYSWYPQYSAAGYTQPTQ